MTLCGRAAPCLPPLAPSCQPECWRHGLSDTSIDLLLQSLQPRLTLAQVEAGGDVLINTTRRRKNQTRNIQIPK